MQKIFLLIAFAVIANLVGAQSSVEKETKEIHFRIDSVFKSAKGFLYADVDGVISEGIEKGLFGKCINLYRGGTSENYKELGTCRIYFAGNGNSGASIDLYSPNTVLRKGDFVSLNISIPKKENHSIFFDLAALNIFLVTCIK